MASRSLPNYSTGVASITNGQRVVTGIGSNWVVSSESQVAAGDWFSIGTSEPILIASVDSATQITLQSPWTGATAASVAYKIWRYVPLPTGSLLAALQAIEARGTDTAPLVSHTVDTGTVRVKMKQTTSGMATVAVGPTGTADGSLLNALRIDPNSGRVGVNIDPATGRIVVSNGGAAPTPMGTLANVSAHLIGADAAINRVLMDARGQVNHLSVRRANGTSTTPTALVAGDTIFTLSGWGYGSTGYGIGQRVYVNLLARENWSDIAQASAIVFGTTPSGSVAAVDRVRIEQDGSVQIAGTFPTTPSTAPNPGISLFPSGAVWQGIASAAVAGAAFSAFYKGGAQVGGITYNGTGVTYNTTSDRRLKKSIRAMAGALEELRRLQPRTFVYRSDETATRLPGFIADELQDVAPYAVTGERDAKGEDGKIAPQMVDVSRLVPLIVGAVNELAAAVDEMRAQAA